MALAGRYVCFSGFCDDDENEDDNDDTSARTTKEGKEGGAKAWSLQAMRMLCESLGAVVQAHITRRTSVLVARQGLTRKRLVAEQHGIPVVSPQWLESHGRLSFADAKVPSLFGYTFCSTQMTAEEEKALSTIIEQNGGIFDRTLTACTSMLFVPPGWMKRWRQQQQQRMCGRPSTGPHGDGPPPVLPEKIRFAWATEIPVVEYPRFLAMAALSSSSNGVNVKCDNVAARADFDTIARLCALPISVAGGLVPHTQRDDGRTEGGAAKAIEEVKEELVKGHSDFSHLEKRPREMDAMNAPYDGDGGPRSKRVRIMQGNDESTIRVPDALQGDDHHEEGKILENEEHSIQTNDEGTVLGPSHVQKDDSLDLISGDAAVLVPPSCHRSCTVRSSSVKASRSEDVFFSDTLFTRSRPFVQVTLLGCTARESVDCIHMIVHCRFMRTPVVTPWTDVVVVGSAFVQEDFGDVSSVNDKKGPPRPLLQHLHQERGQLLARLRDHLILNYGIPIERVVGVEWLHSCYQRMMFQHTPGAMENSHIPFFPASLPLHEMPPTEKYHLRIPSTVSHFEAPLPPPDGQQANEPTAPPSSRLRKRKALHALQQHSRSAFSFTSNAKGVPEAVNTVQQQYEAELRLADHRVKNLLALLDNAAENIERGSTPLISCLFCFVEKEFSRIELAVVRALIKHGKGAWLKKNKDDWVRLLTQIGTNAASEQNQLVETELIGFVRRYSVLRKRLYLMQTEDGEAEEAPLRVSMAVDGRQGRKQSSSDVTTHHPIVALYVVPHGDQRPAECLLKSEVRRGTMPQRHPLRYLPAVTQDYILCCLAAGHMLHPESCFLFSSPMPTEAERLARRRRRSESGKPLSVSPWLGPRRHEKAPLTGISIFFLCAMKDEVSAAAAALRRVMVSCLTAAVCELGGHSTAVLLPETVTHVVVIDIASILESELVPDATVYGSSPWFKTEETEEREREELLLRGSVWPHALQDQLPEDLVEHVVKGRISLVGVEWLHASVAWGVFLDETSFTLTVVQQQEEEEKMSQRQQYGGKSVVAGSAATPPLSPSRRAASADITLLPFESSTRTNAITGMVLSPQAGAGYQFDFSTPTATPVRLRPQKDLLSECNTSVPRQSCPRSTLRTPRRQRVSVPRTISPAVVLVGEAMHTEERSPSEEADTEERCVAATPPHRLEFPTVEKHACTPIRGTTTLGTEDDVNSNGSNDDDVVAVAVSRMRPGYLHGDGKNVPLAVAMPQQWDPEGSSNSCAGPQHSTTPPPVLALNDSGDSLSSRISLASAALRVHIVHDMPDRERLTASCLRLRDAAVNGSTFFNSEGSNSSPNVVCDVSGNFQQQHLPRQKNMAAVFTHLQLVGPSVRDADVLVTHQLTQRESVLAAIAAGLWVVTPKALQDCELRQCFLPLRDLSVYEWCPELLPPGSPRSSLQLAQQCRSRRQQRQATGARLFDGNWFVLVFPDTAGGLARARSMRTVLETGGGVVLWASCVLGDQDAEPAGIVGDKLSSQEDAKMPLTRRSVTPMEEPTSVSSPAALFEFVLSRIRGQEEEFSNGELNKRDDMTKSHSKPAKELILLLDGFLQKNTTRRWLQEIVKVFSHAQASFTEAKKKAFERRQRKQGEDRPQCPPWEFTRAGNEVKGSDVRGNGLTMWPPTRFLPRPALFPVLGPPLRVDTRDRENNVECGMPFLEVVRVFSSDWVTLVIQKRRKAPLCVVEVPS
ncbi:hypothetical protein MOQ_001013 [Trypanosoma cruzi marinkellei]|uniref:BRCT domain-containing protein n=1 Tax=Trypanosoma cruzi marinkellei TaxID=85056 RepID=K2NHB0_TRYCR|nr:hypothetical protein MOQ_001013 [Trypanosoma cruzi marinkellei]